MKNFFLLLAGFMLTGIVFGQNDPKAKEILEQVSKKTQSYSTLSASFVFTMENKRENLKEQNSGSLLLKGKKYQVKLPDLGLQVFSDGVTVWNYMEAANQVTINHAGDDSQGVLDPASIFKVYEQGYNTKFVAEKQEGGKTVIYIDLFPQDNNKEFTKITVAIDKAKMMIHSLITFGKDGNQYGIAVKELKTDLPVADSEFVFNKSKYGDVEVVDFR